MCRPKVRLLGGAVALLVASACGRETANRPPIARAGEDRQVFRGDTVTLDASLESSDPDGDDLDYVWTQLTGELVTLTSDAPAIEFPVTVAGPLVFSVRVSDGRATSTDIVVVDVRNDLQVTQIVPIEAALVSGSQVAAVFFNAAIRPWTAAASVLVENVEDPLNPVPILGNVTLDDDGTAVLFAPAVSWQDGIDYRLTVTTTPAGLDGAPLRDPVIRTFLGSSSDVTPPTVISATPSGPGLVELATTVQVLFSEPVDLATIGAIGLADSAATPQDGAVTLSAGGMRAVFTPADTVPDPDDPTTLAPSTDYVLTVQDTLLDLAANALAGDFVATFRTVANGDTVAPRVSWVSPLYGAGGVSVKLPTVIGFSEPIEPSTLAGTLSVSSGGAPPVGGTVRTLLGNTVAIFEPSANLATNTRYDVLLAGTVTDLSGNLLDGDDDTVPGGDFRSFYRTGSAAPPSVIDINPAQSAVDETILVDITGADFLAGASVFVLGGGVIVGDASVVAQDTIQVALTISPFASIGPRSITVTNPDGQTGTGFGILQLLDRPPEITSVAPDEGNQGASNLPVSIFGASFKAGSAVSLSPAGGITFDTTTVVSSGRIDVVMDIPAGEAIGARDVTVTNPDLQSGTALGAFAVRGPAPTVSTLSPNEGARGEVVTGLVVSGTNFQPLPLPSVSFGAGTAVEVLSADATSITLNLTVFNTAALGLRNVMVTNGDGQSATGVNAFEVLDFPPVIASLNPAAGNQGQNNLLVSVMGTGFATGAMVAIAGGGITFDSTTVVSSTQIDIQIDIAGGAATGTRNVTVTNLDGQANTATGAFLVRLPAPSVTNAVPNDGAQGAVISGVVVNGSNIQPSPLPAVSFGAGTAVSVVSATSTSVTLDLTISPTAALGARDVVITNTDGQSSTDGIGDFTVTAPPPAVSDADPPVSQSAVGTTASVTVTGTGFDCLTGDGPTFAMFKSGVSSTGISVDNVGPPNACSATSFSRDVTVFDTALVGDHDVRVTNPDLQTSAGTGANVFQVREEVPTFTDVTPDPKQGETVAITITGNFFQPGATVATAAGSVSGVSFVNASTLTANISVPYTTAAMDYDVNVTNPDTQSVIATNGITVALAPAPTITSATPNNGGRNLTMDVTLTGTNFQPSVTASFNGAGITTNSTTFVSSTTLSVNITIDAAATLGGGTVTVTNMSSMPNQSVTSGTLFTVIATPPSITAITPNSAAQGDPSEVITIGGTDFVDPVTVSFSGAGISVVSVVLVNSTQLTATISVSAGAATGFRDVTVTNPDGGSDTAINGFTITAAGGGPSISQIDSRGRNFVQGNTVTVQVVGANFAAGATVSVSGPIGDVTESLTTFYTSTRIAVDLTINCGSSVEQGLRDLTVTNPDGKSGTLPNALALRHGIVINEVITDKQTSEDALEVFNGQGAGCAATNLTGWQVEFLYNGDRRLVNEFANTADETVTFGGPGGTSKTNFKVGGYAQIDKVLNSTLPNQVYILLVSDTGRIIDDAEIGDDQEFDGTDGGPAAGNDGAASGASDESVGRCPNGRDLDNDIFDFYQNETGGVGMAKTMKASNSPECPQCSDGIDNAPANGWIDLLDPGCGGQDDNSESGGSTSTACNNNADDDGDTLVDELDPDCFSGADNDESQ